MSKEAIVHEGRNENTLPPLLPRESTTEYLRLHSEKLVIDNRLSDLREILLPLILAGQQSPTDLPFLLINRPQNRKQRDWQAVALAAIQQLVKFGADEQIVAIEEAWPEKEIPSLVVVINPDYVLFEVGS
jgi:hypothetical protein